MNDLIQEIYSINDRIYALRQPFEEFIANKSIDLDVRWDLFVKATTDLKNAESDLTSINSLPDDFIMYDGPVHMDRYQVMSTTDLVDSVEELIANISDDTLRSYMKTSTIEMVKEVNLATLKEEILAGNIGSFTYDW